MKRIVLLLGFFIFIVVSLFFFIPHKSDSHPVLKLIAFTNPLSNPQKVPEIDVDRLYAATGATIKIKPDFLASFISDEIKYISLASNDSIFVPYGTITIYDEKGTAYSLISTMHSTNKRVINKEG